MNEHRIKLAILKDINDVVIEKYPDVYKELRFLIKTYVLEMELNNVKQIIQEIIELDKAKVGASDE